MPIFLKIMFSAFILLMAGLIISPIVQMGQHYYDFSNNYTVVNDTKLLYECNIHSIRRDKELEGEFFLGSGYIENNMYYYVYIETKKDTFLLKQFDAYKTTIIESNDISPCLMYDSHRNSYLIIPKNSIISEYKP